MRSADMPGLCRFHGGCGSVCLSSRERYQLSLDLRQLRLRLRDQARVAAIGLQLSLLIFGSAGFPCGFSVFFRRGISAQRDVALCPIGAGAIAEILERTF
jgi:hypothetical protein